MTLTALIDFADRSVLFREAHALVAGDLYNPLVLDFSQVPRPVADAVDLGSLALVLRRSQGGAVVASCPLFSAVPGRRSLRASSLSMTTKALADWYAELASGRRAVDADGWLEVSDRSLAYVACPVPVVLRDVEARGDVAGYYTASQVDGLLAGKQDALSFDPAPAEGSPNPVTSGGVYAALAGKADAGAVAGKADATAVAALEEKVDGLGGSSGTSVRFLAGDGVELRSGDDLLATARLVTRDAEGAVDRVVLVGEGVYSGTHDLSAGSSWSSWSSSGGAVSFSPATSSFSFSYDGAVVAVSADLPAELGVPMSDVGDVAPTEGSSDRVATSGGTYGYVEGRIATRVSAELHGEDLVATRLLVAQNATSAAQNARGVAGNLRRVLAAEARGYDRGQVDLLVSGKADAFSVSPPLSLSDGALSVDLSSVVSSLSASLVAGVRVNGGAAPKASDGTVDVSAVTSVRLNGADVPVEGGVADVPAVSGVKLNGVAVEPDSSGVVDVRVAVGDAASWRFSSAEPSATADGEYAAELCDGCVTAVGAPPAGASLALRLADSGTGRPRQYAFVLASAPSGFAVVDAATGSAAVCLRGVAAASALAALTGGSVAADRLYRLFETSAGTFAASAC